MKFTCSKEQLDKQVQQISRIITMRNSLPVLSNLLLETDKNILRISGTDLELAMTTHLPAKIEQEGTFTVPAKIFQEFIHQNPDEKIEFTLESYDLICKSEKVEAHISGIDPEEFPALPKVEKSTLVRLPVTELIEALKQVVIACAADQSRPVLTAVYLHLEGKVATLAATDSFRLVEKKLEIVPIQESFTLLIPVRTIQELIRSQAASPEVTELELEISEQQILFRLGTLEIFSRLITGSFPKYQAIIPKTIVTTADITTSELVQALRLSQVFSQAGVSNILMEITDQGVFQISSHGSQRGSTKHTIYALIEDGYTPIRIAFNTKFLLDACSASNATHLKMQFSGPTTPLVLTTEDPNYLQLVMPIRLDS